jgi:hypothetical protein
MHEDLGHFGEHRTLAEIRQQYFWHHRTEDVKAVFRSCQQCQLMKSEGRIRSGDEQMKSIPICDLFYRVALDTAGPLPETKSGNKYILVAIDHYSKWCEARAVSDHGAKQEQFRIMVRSKSSFGSWCEDCSQILGGRPHLQVWRTPICTY